MPPSATESPSRGLRWLLEQDFFPNTSAHVRRFVASPLGVLSLAIVATTLCGLTLHPRVFALAGGLAAVLAVGVWWPWLTLRGVGVTLAFDRGRAIEGDDVSVTASVRNHWPWPAWGLIVKDGVSRATAWVRLEGLVGRSRTSCRWSARPACRGVYPITSPTIATAFPFGLWESRRKVEVARPLIVWPRTFPVGPVPAASGEEASDGSLTRHKAGSAGDLMGVRPYRRGDSPRRIHWAASARHDRLIVCEVQSASRPAVLLVLDTDIHVHTSGPDGTREWAVRIAASLAAGWLDEGAQVALTWDGQALPIASGAGHKLRILDALARIPADTHRPITDLLRSPIVSRVPAAVRIVITTDAARLGTHDDFRIVSLNRRGFPGGDGCQPTGCDEGRPRRTPKPWLDITSPERLPHALRYGWSEARHGS